MAGKYVLSLRRLQQASIGIHANTIAQFAGAPRQHLFKRRMGLVVLAFLHQAQRSLVLCDQLCACVVRCRERSSQRAWSTLRSRCICRLRLSHGHSVHLTMFLSVPILTVARYQFVLVSVLYADRAARSTGESLILQPFHPSLFFNSRHFLAPCHFLTIDSRIQLRVVIHLHLPV